MFFFLFPMVLNYWLVFQYPEIFADQVLTINEYRKIEQREGTEDWQETSRMLKCWRNSDLCEKPAVSKKKRIPPSKRNSKYLMTICEETKSKSKILFEEGSKHNATNRIISEYNVISQAIYFSKEYRRCKNSLLTKRD